MILLAVVALLVYIIYSPRGERKNTEEYCIEIFI